MFCMCSIKCALVGGGKFQQATSDLELAMGDKLLQRISVSAIHVKTDRDWECSKHLCIHNYLIIVSNDMKNISINKNDTIDQVASWMF